MPVAEVETAIHQGQSRLEMTLSSGLAATALDCVGLPIRRAKAEDAIEPPTE